MREKAEDGQADPCTNTYWQKNTRGRRQGYSYMWTTFYTLKTIDGVAAFSEICLEMKLNARQ